MTDDSYARLRDLFERCLDVPEGERPAWLEANVAETGLRIELELMLAADSHGGGFLARDVVSRIGWLDAHAGGPAADDDTGVDGKGDRFGPFELRSVLGRGGQGTVYLAERVGSDFRQTVAIKVLRRDLHSDGELRRFRREREILANVEHPGIARLVDGGVSGCGVPYLAMEYVDGRAIDAWCEEHRVATSARLRLFRELCEAVAAAHRALIVHRDLKPSNVFVNGDGAIKVLDFGIARLLDDDDGGDRTGVPLMTPGYCAPEQVSCGPITLSTDVHALGVLLRVLLTGEDPGRDARFAERPLPRGLAPELRWMIGKACEVEPERRYRDAAEFGEDVGRYLEARPLRAHPPSRTYRMRKFVQRHRGGVLVTAALVLGLLASFAISMWQAQVAREQARRAEAARSFMLGVFQAAREELPKDVRPTPDMLVRIAAKNLDADTGLPSALRAEFLGTLATISYSSSDYELADGQADRALALYDAAGRATSREALGLQVLRAEALSALARPDEALCILERWIAPIRGADDDVAVRALAAYAAADVVTGRVEQARELARESVQVAERAHGADSREALHAAADYGGLLALAGFNREAVQVLEPVLSRWRAGAAPVDARLAGAIQSLSDAKYLLGNAAESESLQREALALLRRIYTAPHERIADALFSLGTPLMDTGRDDEAEQVMQEAAQMYATLFGPMHPQNAGMLDGLGSLELKRQQPQKAVEYFERATRICIEAKLERNPDCARFWQNLSAAYVRVHRLVDAEAANARSIEIRRVLLGEKHPAYAGSLAGRAYVLNESGRDAEALVSIDQALAIFTATGQGNSIGGATMRKTRASILLNLRRSAEALAMLDEADAVAAKAEPGNAQYVLTSLVLRAEILDAIGRHGEAREVARRALASRSTRTTVSPERWRRIEALAR